MFVHELAAVHVVAGFGYVGVEQQHPAVGKRPGEFVPGHVGIGFGVHGAVGF